MTVTGTCTRPNWPAWSGVTSGRNQARPGNPLVQQTIEDCLTEAMDIDGLIEVLSRLVGAGRMGAALRKVVEADREEIPVPRDPIEGLGSPADNIRSLAFSEEQFAVPIAIDRVENRVDGLAFHLEPLGFREQACSLGGITGLMERFGKRGAAGDHTGLVGAAVSEIDCLPGHIKRFGYVAEGEVESAEVARTDG